MRASVNVACGSCGREFPVHPYRLSVGRGKYCSSKCRAKGVGLAIQKDLADQFFYTEAPNGCWLWARAVAKNGYGVLNVRGRSRRAHRVAYETFVGPIPRGLDVCHRCDVRRCVNPAHLFIGTRKDNLRDMSVKGRASAPAAKLTPTSVRAIRRMQQSDVPNSLIRRMYGVSAATLSAIRNARTWKHVY